MPDVWNEVGNVFEVNPRESMPRLRLNYGNECANCHKDSMKNLITAACINSAVTGVRLSEHASFKTPDRMRNLQLTFANNVQEAMTVDAVLST